MEMCTLPCGLCVGTGLSCAGKLIQNNLPAYPQPNQLGGVAGSGERPDMVPTGNTNGLSPISLLLTRPQHPSLPGGIPLPGQLWMCAPDPALTHPFLRAVSPSSPAPQTTCTSSMPGRLQGQWAQTCLWGSYL